MFREVLGLAGCKLKGSSTIRCQKTIFGDVGR